MQVDRPVIVSPANHEVPYTATHKETITDKPLIQRLSAQ